MRGEEPQDQIDLSQHPELPPHARRRGKADTGDIPENGITSACAEKS